MEGTSPTRIWSTRRHGAASHIRSPLACEAQRYISAHGLTPARYIPLAPPSAPALLEKSDLAAYQFGINIIAAKPHQYLPSFARSSIRQTGYRTPKLAGLCKRRHNGCPKLAHSAAHSPAGSAASFAAFASFLSSLSRPALPILSRR